METYSVSFKPVGVRGHNDSCKIPLNLNFLKGCWSQTYLIIPQKIPIAPHRQWGTTWGAPRTPDNVTGAATSSPHPSWDDWEVL